MNREKGCDNGTKVGVPNVCALITEVSIATKDEIVLIFESHHVFTPDLLLVSSLRFHLRFLQELAFYYFSLCSKRTYTCFKTILIGTALIRVGRGMKEFAKSVRSDRLSRLRDKAFFRVFDQTK